MLDPILCSFILSPTIVWLTENRIQDYRCFCWDLLAVSVYVRHRCSSFYHDQTRERTSSPHRRSGESRAASIIHSPRLHSSVTVWAWVTTDCVGGVFVVLPCAVGSRAVVNSSPSLGTPVRKHERVSSTRHHPFACKNHAFMFALSLPSCSTPMAKICARYREFVDSGNGVAAWGSTPSCLEFFVGQGRS